MSACCSPGREPADGPAPKPGEGVTARSVDGAGLVEVPGGKFKMGAVGTAAYDGDGEGPVHAVTLDTFRLGAGCVTNAEYAEFAVATGHASDAERFGWSFVFEGLLPDGFEDTPAVVQTPWWRQVTGADWAHPEGPGSDTAGREDHPVVHVSWNDATAYCAWRGARLPTEAEWERAARGRLVGAAFPWGDDLEPGGEHRMNVFQGEFPGHDTGADGWTGTAPVTAYPANDFGLHNMTGNVWEWCADWYDPASYRSSPKHNPLGPGNGSVKAMRGGSYLCHDSYCRRYRVSARSGNTPDSSAGNVGFRIAVDGAAGADQ